MDLIGAVAKTIEQHGLLQPGQGVVAAVSGGPDSLCLLDCLRRLEYHPVVAHFDHGLRAESAAEAEHVAELAERWGLPVERGRADVRAASNGRGSLEEVGRQLRYQFLVQAAAKHDLQVIATGHTADDQVETVLMHLLRGAGPSGLQGMLPDTALSEWVGIRAPAGMRLIRPLLANWRAEVEAHCRVRGLEPVHDLSNLDRRHFRNRLRHDLLPILEDYNPQVRRILYRTARIMAAERELMQGLVRKLWPQLVREAGVGCLALDREALLREPVALQRALARSVVYTLRPELRDVGFETVESILGFAADPASRRQTVVGELDLLDLGAEIVLRIPGASIRFPWYPQLQQAEPQRIAAPGSYPLAEGWELRLDRVELTPALLEQLTGGDPARQAAVDPSTVQGGLRLRPPAPGDRLNPLGMDGSLKVADLFVNRSILWPARRSWPLLVDDRSVIWVAGLHLSRDHRLTADSRQALKLQLAVGHQAHQNPRG